MKPYQERRAKRPLAIVSCLAPEQSGVALFASQAFDALQQPIHFFSSAATPDELNTKLRRIVTSGAATRSSLSTTSVAMNS
jgi:hypothetical protein